jgi:hypothetical protein
MSCYCLHYTSAGDIPSLVDLACAELNPVVSCNLWSRADKNVALPRWLPAMQSIIYNRETMKKAKFYQVCTNTKKHIKEHILVADKKKCTSELDPSVQGLHGCTSVDRPRRGSTYLIAYWNNFTRVKGREEERASLDSLGQCVGSTYSSAFSLAHPWADQDWVQLVIWQTEKKETD